jgi:hypothetical protein
METCGLHDEVCGDNVVIHIDCIKVDHGYVATRDAMMKSLSQVQAYTRYMFPYYNYFKLQEYNGNEVDVA